MKQVNNKVFGWKLKGIYNSELKPFHDLASAISNFGHKIALRFNYSILSVTQNNYKTKIVNVFIFYDLNNWPRSVIEKFKIKICLFCITNIVKISAKQIWV